LVERLEAIVSDATALTMGEAAAASIDEKALMTMLSSASKEMMDHAGGNVPILEQLEARLEATLARAPNGLSDLAMDYQRATLKWRPDPPAMPREIAAFVVLERLQTARESCLYLLAKERHQALRNPGDRCDCAARVAAAFFFGQPEGPLKQLDSSGVPYAAMDYLLESEPMSSWDSSSSHLVPHALQSQRLAPSDAVRA
jgi:hypothetical protein